MRPEAPRSIEIHDGAVYVCMEGGTITVRVEPSAREADARSIMLTKTEARAMLRALSDIDKIEGIGGYNGEE